MPEYKYVDFSKETRKKIEEAVGSILGGICSRVDVNKNVKVYECKNVIRIDLKITESSEEF
jgi:hypothetical protein